MSEDKPLYPALIINGTPTAGAVLDMPHLFVHIDPYEFCVQKNNTGV